MKKNPTWLPVVALALFDDQGRVLLSKRPPNKHHGGLWEFPGGKMDSGESPRRALVREIEEEMGLTLEPSALEPVAFAEEFGDRHVVLFLYTARKASGTVEGREGQAFGWFSPDAASALALAPMDRTLLQKLPG